MTGDGREWQTAHGDVPSVSVVMATNRGPGNQLLTDTLASLAAQTLHPLELIIVDDGGPSPFVPDSLPPGLPPTRIVRLAPSGPSYARNVGAALAHGELIAFLDDDDLWHPERLAVHAQAMGARPDIALSYSRMHSVDVDGNEIAPANQVQVRDVSDVYRRITGIMLPNTVVRADAFHAVGGFNPVFHLAEDLDLVLRLALRGSTVLVGDHSLVAYRQHRGNVTHRHRALAASIREVLRLHRWAALQRGDRALADALAVGLDANDRYAAWCAARAARALTRDGAVVRATGELVWALAFAPRAPVSWLRKRVSARFARASESLP